MNDTYIYFNPDLVYPSQQYSYSPSEKYAEYAFADELSPEKNYVYEAVRSIFKEYGLDTANWGTSSWNPLGDYIRPGQTVLLKPNLVSHKNNSQNPNDLECMVTHPSIIRCVLDYVFIALKGQGKIYIGDAPVKDCNFNELLKKGNYNPIIAFYKEKAPLMDIEWIDLRGPEEERYSECPFQGITVNLGRDSYFYNYKYTDRLRVPNYDKRHVIKHHVGETQEYCINEIALKADVIINLPKPKTHRKNGYTAALKNFVGISYGKEYLPHHTQGDLAHGGDEYEKGNLYKSLASTVRDNIDIIRTRIGVQNNEKGQIHLISKTAITLLWKIYNILIKADKKITGHKMYVTEGTWYKNNTLWRTILDLNHIIRFADKNGNIRQECQRTILHLGDMIISGEKEGPLAPSPKEENILVFSDNAVCFDFSVVKIMGFDWNKLTILKKISETNFENFIGYENITILSNDASFNGCLKNISFDKLQPFEAAGGWKGYIEISARK